MSSEDGVWIGPARAADVDRVADLWVELARGQRGYGSELLGMGNRTAIRESLARSAVTGELLLARASVGGEGGGDAAAGGEDRAKNDGAAKDRGDVADGAAAGTDAEVVGFVSFALDRGSFERERTRGIVTNLYVVPERRGEGIGSRLLDAAERALAELGAATITLESMAANDRARGFYRDRGYAPHRVTYIKESPTPKASGASGTSGTSEASPAADDGEGDGEDDNGDGEDDNGDGEGEDDDATGCVGGA